MKNTRRFAAFVASVLAVACMAAPMATSFSAEAAGSISISNTATGHTYEAYQIFDGDLADGVLSNIVWGTGVDSSKTTALLNAIKAINLDTGIIVVKGGTATTTPFASVTSAADVAKVLSDGYYADAEATTATAFGNDAEITQKFASVVGQYLSATKSTSVFSSGTYTISKVDDGYYLVKDADDSLNQAHDAKTRYIIQVLGTQENISPKSSFPTVEKKVLEDDKAVTGKPTYDSTTTEKWNDVADYCIGEAVPFKLYGTLPSTLADYDKYKYVFHDTLASQFTITADTAVTVKIDGKTPVVAPTIAKDTTANTITVTFNDIIAAGATKDSIVTVEYSAVLNNTAVIGLDGQQNKVYLTYSNNPNWVGDGTGGSGDTPDDNGKTPEDKVIVFTYELDTTKVDGVDNTKKLAGAEFKLMDSTKKKYAKVNASTYKFEGWATTEEEGTTLKSDGNGLFKVIGLDDGTYYLKETKAPTGYNLLASDVEVVLTATTANNQAWAWTPSDALTALAVTADSQPGTGDADTGIASITIANNAGSSLPGTGGMGTTLFYVGGGALVVGAGVLLVTKKRMANK